jgi:hypothetical protein
MPQRTEGRKKATEQSERLSLQLDRGVQAVHLEESAWYRGKLHFWEPE